MVQVARTRLRSAARSCVEARAARCASSAAHRVRAVRKQGARCASVVRAQVDECVAQVVCRVRGRGGAARALETTVVALPNCVS
jgi:hypothetical protein